ncbi:MAG: hypothetical protein AMJ88_04305 [Anaerolineae bacterium SM23_ 63]|nr:MAG: hypothetical protein AMJ88_04305 [Anaerolineae bacterium SM23_ 63]HEY45243.1 hypothetical protein [Anaerolineae bacterium]
MENPSKRAWDSPSPSTEARTSPPDVSQDESQRLNPELDAAIKRLRTARTQFISAAIAFCDGLISDGQLRATRELLREKEILVEQLAKGDEIPIIEEPLPEGPPQELEVVDTGPLETEVEVDLTLPEDLTPDLKSKLEELNRKYERLKEDYKRGHINATQYNAIRAHYLEQREVALRLRETHPDSDRWQVVLEEGKTTFLMQLNEAACISVGIYDIKSRERIFVQGDMPVPAEASMSLLSTFGSSKIDPSSDRMYATQIEDGSALLLIPGVHTVCLVAFTQPPPDWQVRALREVHRHFETANMSALGQGKRQSLIFPNMKRFIRA